MKELNSNDRLVFPATLRNRDSISNVLTNYIPNDGVLLEIASGSGEHAVFFQRSFPSIIWQASDPDVLHRKSINSWIEHFGLSSKMPEPLNIDVEKRPWPVPSEHISFIKVIVCINMIHISPWRCTKALFEEAKNVLNKPIHSLYEKIKKEEKNKCKSVDELQNHFIYKGIDRICRL